MAAADAAADAAAKAAANAASRFSSWRSGAVEFKHFNLLGSCIVHIDVTKSSDGSCYDVTYTNRFVNQESYGGHLNHHPLYEQSVAHDDPSLLDGVVVVANPMTTCMIDCLMRHVECQGEVQAYPTGNRPWTSYCGEIMRALAELEA